MSVLNFLLFLSIFPAILGTSLQDVHSSAHFDDSLPEAQHVLQLHPVDPVISRSRRRQLRASEMTPLFPGYGTHYVYAYIGTPPQRQSLIVDTGSHFTAFPCTGCKQCGDHTDSYWDIKKSSTVAVPKCPNFKDGKCQVQQSYTEGSSWHGFKVQDRLWVGGEKAHFIPSATEYAVNFTFACQTEETGLFRTQLADGIMGMSAAADTLPNVLAEAKVTDTKVFALCYRNGGGIFTIGGVSQQIHAKRSVNYAQMEVRQGWYGVTLTNIRFIDPKTGTVTELPPATKNLFGASSSGKRRLMATGIRVQKRTLSKDTTSTSTTTINNKVDKDSSKTQSDKKKPAGIVSTAAAAASAGATGASGAVVNVGRGIIVDSGTTDTYLPSALADGFKTAFKAASKGIVYSTGNFPLTAAQMAQLPDIAFDLLPLNTAAPSSSGSNSSSGEAVTIRMPVTSYLDSVGQGKYTFRIYLTEKSGGVLGANFMNDLNVIFDVDNQRLGFVKSTCNFEEFNSPVTNTPTMAPSKPPSAEGSSNDGSESSAGGCGTTTPLTYSPYTQCSARCDQPDNAAYMSSGTQDFIASCSPSASSSSATDLIITRPCAENCTHSLSVRGDPKCPDTPWTECSHACITTRKVVPLTEPLMKKVVSHGNVNYVCNYQTQTSACYTAQCPRQDGDYLLYIDLHLRVDASRWSYVYAESFFVAFTSLFHLPSPHNVELLNNYNSDSSLASSSSSSSYGSGSSKSALRLHFQIRLKRRDYKSELLLHDAAETIITKFRSADFSRDLLETLDAISQVQDRNAQRRFGWLYAQDIVVLSAVALPIGDTRNPYDTAHRGGGPKGANGGSGGVEDDGNGGNGEQRYSLFGIVRLTMSELLLIGGAIAVVSVLGVVIYLHLRLREEYALLSKDKSTLARSGQALRKLWTKFADMAAVSSHRRGAEYYATGSNAVLDLTGGDGAGHKKASVSAQQQELELELSRRGLMTGDDEDDDQDDRLERADYGN